MDNSFIAYLERLEILIFFSGYPMVYLLVSFVGGLKPVKKALGLNMLYLMPAAYILTCLLFIGLQVKNLYPEFTYANLQLNSTQPFLKIWALLPLLLFIPALFKRPALSLLHGLFFFFLVVKDVYIQFFENNDSAAIKNSMFIYSNSLLINFASFVFILLATLLLKRLIGKKL